MEWQIKHNFKSRKSLENSSETYSLKAASQILRLFSIPVARRVLLLTQSGVFPSQRAIAHAVIQIQPSFLSPHNNTINTGLDDRSLQLPLNCLQLASLSSPLFSLVLLFLDLVFSSRDNIQSN